MTGPPPVRTAPWSPGTGDVISVRMAGASLDLRPALVLSPAAFSVRTQIVIACPVVEEARGGPFEVPVPPRSCVTGVVLADRVTSLDLRRNPLRWAGELGGDVVAAVLERLLPLLVPLEDVEQFAALSRAYTHASIRTPRGSSR